MRNSRRSQTVFWVVFGVVAVGLVLLLAAGAGVSNSRSQASGGNGRVCVRCKEGWKETPLKGGGVSCVQKKYDTCIAQADNFTNSPFCKSCLQDLCTDIDADVALKYCVAIESCAGKRTNSQFTPSIAPPAPSSISPPIIPPSTPPSIAPLPIIPPSTTPPPAPLPIVESRCSGPQPLSRGGEEYVCMPCGPRVVGGPFGGESVRWIWTTPSAGCPI